MSFKKEIILGKGETAFKSLLPQVALKLELLPYRIVDITMDEGLTLYQTTNF